MTQFGKELKGEERVVVDQLITRQQCERLVKLAAVSLQWNVCVLRTVMMMYLCTQFSTEGDGYHGRKSPHTTNEKFEGLHILDAAKVMHTVHVHIYNRCSHIGTY